MLVFPSSAPAPVPGPLPFGANHRETLWRYRQAVWSLRPTLTETERRGEANQPAQQSPSALCSAAQKPCGA